MMKVAVILLPLILASAVLAFPAHSESHKQGDTRDSNARVTKQVVKASMTANKSSDTNATPGSSTSVDHSSSGSHHSHHSHHSSSKATTPNAHTPSTRVGRSPSTTVSTTTPKSTSTLPTHPPTTFSASTKISPSIPQTTPQIAPKLGDVEVDNVKTDPSSTIKTVATAHPVAPSSPVVSAEKKADSPQTSTIVNEKIASAVAHTTPSTKTTPTTSSSTTTTTHKSGIKRLFGKLG